MLYLCGDGELVCIDVAVLTTDPIRQLSEAFTCKKAPILRKFYFNTVSLICSVLKLCFPAHLFTDTLSNFTLTMSSIYFFTSDLLRFEIFLLIFDSCVDPFFNLG